MSDDLRDDEQRERLEHAAPEEALRRREFLQRTALTAGLAGLSTILPAQTLVAEAARKQRRNHIPSPRNMPIDTFVVLMMENRSFDHYLGWMPDADGRQAGLSFVDKQGVSHATHRLTPGLAGLRSSRPRPLVVRRTRPAQRRQDGRLPADRQRRVRDRLLRRGRPRRSSRTRPRRSPRSTTSTARSWAARCPTASTCTPRSPTGNIDNDLPPQTAYQTGFPWTRRSCARCRQGRLATSTTTSTFRSRRCGGAGPGAVQPGRRLLRGAARPARCPASRSSIRTSPAAWARARARRATSTPTATCAWARRSWPTSSTPSWIRRSSSAGRCSSSTTNGAASSTTSCPSASRHPQHPDIDKDFGLMGFRIPSLTVSPYAAPRPRRALDLRLRVDPQDDRVPLRAQAADPPRRLRDEHRPRVRLGVQAAARAARAPAPRARGQPAVRDRRHAAARATSTT